MDSFNGQYGYYTTPLYGGPMMNQGLVQSPMYAPMPTLNAPQKVQVQDNDNKFIWVQGVEAAKAYPVAPEKTVLFLDDQEPLVYKKTTDKEGKTVDFKIYKLVEQTSDEPESKEQLFATKEDIGSLSVAIEELKDMILNKPKYNNNKGVNKTNG